MTERDLDKDEAPQRKTWEQPTLTEANIEEVTQAGATCAPETFCPLTPASKGGS